MQGILVSPLFFIVTIVVRGCLVAIFWGGMSMVFATIGGFGCPRPRMLEPRPVGHGGGVSGSGSTR